MDRIFQVGIAGLIFLIGVNTGFFVNEYQLYPTGSLLNDFDSLEEYNDSMKVSLTRVGSNKTHVLFAQCSNGVDAREINQTNYNSSRILDNCFFHTESKPIATAGVEHTPTDGDSQ